MKKYTEEEIRAWYAERAAWRAARAAAALGEKQSG
jgi:hypothetical protein